MARPVLGAVIATLIVGLAGGCPRDPSSLPREWDILERDVMRSTQVSRKVMLVADNQVHYLFGDPFLHRNVFADVYLSKVTIRSPQLDLFGQDLFRWALDSSQRMPVLHLGDAMDLACGEEFSRFVALMRESERPWVMTPGNHDAFFYGNFDSSDRFWSRACRDGGGPMHKDILLARYLDELGRTRPSLAARVRDQPEGGEWTCNARRDGDCFLRAVRWRITREARWRSFIVQEVDLSQESSEPYRVILFDSTQHASQPTEVLLNAGSVGSVLEDQADVVRHWIGRAARSGARVALATHHPFDGLSTQSRERVVELMQTDAVVLLITAHTHAGRYYTHGSGEHTWLELNVGSILDWPAEYRTLAFRRTLAGSALDPGKLIIASELIRLEEQWRQELEADVPRCEDPGWEARPGEPDYYLGYRALAALKVEDTQRRIYDNLLAAYARMFRSLPPRAGAASGVEAVIERARRSRSLGDKRAALQALQRLEQDGVFADDRAHREYRLCQAAWASRYEFRRARVPNVDDEYIVAPDRGGEGRLP